MTTASPAQSRILIVDDEEAILETMAFTFSDQYDVLTAGDASKGLEILRDKAPVSAVITDQRMPNMTGVEFLAKVYQQHPATTRIILTGFADMDAIIKAINDGHVYAYINKPWEPAELKQLVRRAVDHHHLTLENERLVTDLQRANTFLEALMDRLPTGALALDESGIVQASNRSAEEYLELETDPRGRTLADVLSGERLAPLEEATRQLLESDTNQFQELDLPVEGGVRRLRVRTDPLLDPKGSNELGRVILLREISHEPIRRRFEELLGELTREKEDLRARLLKAGEELRGISLQVQEAQVPSASMQELDELASRTQTAIQNWLDVDDALAESDYPDAQLLMDRMRVATARWPVAEKMPEAVLTLARRVEAYYESGENPKRRTL